jgi:Sugar (and other) transporter
MERLHDQIISRNGSAASDGLWSTLRRPEIYKPLAIINAFFAFQQFSGTFVIIVYATQFAAEAGAGLDKFLVTVLIGVSRVVATIFLAYFILDKYGRKPPSIFSGIGLYSRVERGKYLSPLAPRSRHDDFDACAVGVCNFRRAPAAGELRDDGLSAALHHHVHFWLPNDSIHHASRAVSPACSWLNSGHYCLHRIFHVVRRHQVISVNVELAGQRSDFPLLRGCLAARNSLRASRPARDEGQNATGNRKHIQEASDKRNASKTVEAIKSCSMVSKNANFLVYLGEVFEFLLQSPGFFLVFWFFLNIDADGRRKKNI